MYKSDIDFRLCHFLFYAKFPVDICVGIIIIQNRINISYGYKLNVHRNRKENIMKKIKLTAIALVLVLAVSVLAGCGKKAEEQKVLKVATNASFPPYEYYENEKAVGIDVDIMQAIADKIGYQMELTDMEFGSIIPAVQTGKVDVGFGAVTITEERSKSVHFTTSYATGIQTVILAVDSPISSIDDLYGADIKIGVQQDTTGDIYATGDFGEEHIARFLKGADAVNALLTGKVNAVIIDDSPAKTFVAQNEGKLIVLPTAYAEEAYGFMCSYENEELYNKVNTALEELLADGSVQKIIDKYIKAE